MRVRTQSPPVGEETKPRAHHDFDTVVRWLYELRATGYYGDIELKFYNGQCVSVSPRPSCRPGEALPIFSHRKRLEPAG